MCSEPWDYVVVVTFMLQHPLNRRMGEPPRYSRCCVRETSLVPAANQTNSLVIHPAAYSWQWLHYANLAPGFNEALHLNYSTTNINKTHSMRLGVVLQFKEPLPPQNFYSKEATVLLGYTELPDCGHASLPYCAMSDHYVHGVILTSSSSVVNCRLQSALQHSSVTCTVNSLSSFLILFQNKPLHIPEGYQFFFKYWRDTAELLLSWETRMFPLHTLSLVFWVQMVHPCLIASDHPIQ
jgi:hypothetical protein